MNEIKTVALHDKELIGLAHQIENYQNKSGLISKGSLPFYNSNTGEYSVIMFFPKPIDNIQPVKSGIQPASKGENKQQSIVITSPSSNIPKKASDKQIAYAQTLADELDMDLKINEDMTSKEISFVIKDLIKRLNEKGGKK